MAVPATLTPTPTSTPSVATPTADPLPSAYAQLEALVGQDAARPTVRGQWVYLIADSVMVGIYSVEEAVLMVGPAAVALCLLLPPSVRQMLGPIGVPAAFQGMQVTPGAPVAPGTPSAPGQAPGGQFHGGPPASPDQPQAGGQG